MTLKEWIKQEQESVEDEEKRDVLTLMQNSLSEEVLNTEASASGFKAAFFYFHSGQILKKLETQKEASDNE